MSLEKHIVSVSEHHCTLFYVHVWAQCACEAMALKRRGTEVSVVFTAWQLQDKCRVQHQNLLLIFVNLSKPLALCKETSVGYPWVWMPKQVVNILQQFCDR